MYHKSAKKCYNIKNMAQETNKPIIDLTNINKSFIEGDSVIKILENLDLKIFTGEKVAIIGPSGSGKSTLLSLLAGLDTQDEGEIIIDGVNLKKLKQDDLSNYRNKTIGIVFQSFELVSPFNAIENIEAPSDIAGKTDSAYARELIISVGLKDKEYAYPSTLSGGEKQRVAIARALINKSKIILADEPTGSLDRETGKKVLDLLLNEVTKEKKTLVLITHDEHIANQMDRILEIKDKKLFEKINIKN